jgi:CO dehydrogenase/acetyl-CoA synthase beta subunit
MIGVGSSIILSSIVMPSSLVLTKTDYQNAVYDFKMNQRNKRFNFLQSVKFFQENWTYAKQVEFNNILKESASSYNQIIYDIDDSADKIYLIKSGKAIVETLIQINEENTYPIVRDIAAHNFIEPKRMGKKTRQKANTLQSSHPVARRNFWY